MLPHTAERSLRLRKVQRPNENPRWGSYSGEHDSVEETGMCQQSVGDGMLPGKIATATVPPTKSRTNLQLSPSSPSPSLRVKKESIFLLLMSLPLKAPVSLPKMTPEHLQKKKKRTRLIF